MPEPAENMTGTDPDTNPELYVGYLPVPARLRRFLRVAVPLLVVVIAASGVIVATSQTDPGPAAWENDRAVTVSGVVWADPYPCLYADDRGDGRPGARPADISGSAGRSVRHWFWLTIRFLRPMKLAKPRSSLPTRSSLN